MKCIHSSSVFCSVSRMVATPFMFSLGRESADIAEGLEEENMAGALRVIDGDNADLFGTLIRVSIMEKESASSDNACRTRSTRAIAMADGFIIVCGVDLRDAGAVQLQAQEVM